MFVFPFIEVRFVLETILLPTPKNLLAGIKTERSSNPEVPLLISFQVWMGP